MRATRSLTSGNLSRREFLDSVAVASCAAVLGVASPAWAGDEASTGVATNVGDFLKVPRGPHAIPGPFPGRVVRVEDARALVAERFDAGVIRGMVEEGIRRLTGTDLKRSFALFFAPDDIVGIKVNPVGAPLISTRVEVVDALVRWLVDNGVKAKQIVIWDRFEVMLGDAGFTRAHFPGVGIEGLQMMDENGDGWRDSSGRHRSEGNFDLTAAYVVTGVVGKGVRGYQDDVFYLNQHVFNGEASYFGALVTRRLTKIINVAAYKNTGHAISMATKNLGYGALCNTGRLHAPLGLAVNTEVLAAPWLRDKLVLNVTDGLRGQFDGGPDQNAQFIFPNRALYFATDPFALDTVCHQELLATRRAMGVKVDEHPRTTDYLRYGQRLGLGVADPSRIRLLRVVA
jgi:hypothetical protein